MEQDLTLHRAEAPYDWAALLRLITAAFAGMEGRIDPPSSVHRLTVEAIAAQADKGEIWVVGVPPRASVFLTVKPPVLYLGKIAVDHRFRRQGLAKALVEKAESRARALGLGVLELQSRIELVENHAAFAALGFRQVGMTSHPGYENPTSLTFQKAVEG